MKILAFMKYGDIAASTRQRLLQYDEIFKESGISVEHSPLLDNKYLGQIMSGGKPNRTDVIRAYFDRALHLISKKQFDKRCKFINTFEELLIEENNTLIFKFFLHISKDEEFERLMERKNDPEKRWKHNPKDFEVNERWEEYIKVYDEIIDKTDKQAKWNIIPADNKWYRNYRVASALVKGMEKKIRD